MDTDVSTSAKPAPPRQRVPAAGFGMVVVLWALFAAVLVLEPARLDEAWSWFRDLPALGQVAGWVVLLPWVLATLVWGASWALWVRLLVVAFLALASLTMFSPRRA